MKLRLLLHVLFVETSRAMRQQLRIMSSRTSLEWTPATILLLFSRDLRSQSLPTRELLDFVRHPCHWSRRDIRGKSFSVATVEPFDTKLALTLQSHRYWGIRSCWSHHNRWLGRKEVCFQSYEGNADIRKLGLEWR